MLSMSLSALPSEAECCRGSGPLLSICRSESLYLKHTVGEGLRPTSHLKTASAPTTAPLRDLTGETKSIQRNVLFQRGISGDVLSCCLLTPLSPSAIFFHPRLLLPAHHFWLHTTLTYPLLSLPRLSLCLSQLPVCLILNPVEIGQAE